MKLGQYLLDEWLARYQFAEPPIRYDLAASTGPHWTLRQVMEFFDDQEREELLNSDVYYTHGSGTPKLRAAIAEYQGVEPDQIQITIGAIEALMVLFFLAAEPGANVVVPFPCFPPFAELPRSFGLEVRQYRLTRENGFRLDIDEIKRLADSNTKLILLNSPHNPTGLVIEYDQLRAVHDFAVERGIQFVVDEVYHPIYYGRDAVSAASLPHATVIGDFSKAFCLSGLRCGWILDRDRKRMEEYLNTRCYFTVSNSMVTEALAVAAVRHRDEIFGRAKKAAAANLAILDKFFGEFSDMFGWIRPGAGMIGFPWLKSGVSSREFCERLAAQGFMLAPGDCFGVPEHFRVGFAALENTEFSQAIQELRTAITRVRAAV